MDRRGFLAAGASAGVTATAGCLGGILGGGSQGLTLPSLDVAGSPGGTVALRPPEKVVLLDFFATWCAPCRPQMANLGVVRDRFDEEQLHMVSITQESSERAIKDFWRQFNGRWPVAQDTQNEATRKYSVTGIPTLILLTPDGKTAMRHRGLAGQNRLVESVTRALQDAGMA